MYKAFTEVSQGEGQLWCFGREFLSVKHDPRPHPKPQFSTICPQDTDNPTASHLFAEQLKALREKDGFGTVLFSSHVRKVGTWPGGHGEQRLEGLRRDLRQPQPRSGYF